MVTYMRQTIDTKYPGLETGVVHVCQVCYGCAIPDITNM